jgi:hypothetical protein
VLRALTCPFFLYQKLAAFCAEMKADPKLAGGVNVLGFSQVTHTTHTFMTHTLTMPVRTHMWICRAVC